MGIKEYNEEVLRLSGELESIVKNYDTLIESASSKDVSQMLISKRDAIIFAYDHKLNNLNNALLPEEESQ